MVEEKKLQREKPLVVPLTFNQALSMIATGGKTEIKKRPKTGAKTKKKAA